MSLFIFTSCVKFHFCSEIVFQMKSHYSLFVFISLINENNQTNETYYFYNDLINIKDFDPKLLKLDKKSYKKIDIYYIGYITKKDEYKINSVNPLICLFIE